MFHFNYSYVIVINNISHPEISNPSIEVGASLTQVSPAASDTIILPLLIFLPSHSKD